jgi:uncharacterized membrane protein YphA (DoxX/SURF4 family)
MARAMGPALVVARVLLACVFLLAGVAKLAALTGSRRAALDFGVPVRFAGVVGAGLPVVRAGGGGRVVAGRLGARRSAGRIGVVGVFYGGDRV